MDERPGVALPLLPATSPVLTREGLPDVRLGFVFALKALESRVVVNVAAATLSFAEPLGTLRLSNQATFDPDGVQVVALRNAVDDLQAVVQTD